METDQLTTCDQILEVLHLTRDLLGRIGDRWTLLTVTVLEGEGTLRFSQLKSLVGGITQKVLTQTLRGLEREGLVHREAYPTVPVTVEYSLTPLGHSLASAVSVIRQWSADHREDIATAREQFDAKR